MKETINVIIRDINNISSNYDYYNKAVTTDDLKALEKRMLEKMLEIAEKIDELNS